MHRAQWVQPVRRALLRTAYLLVGAAICLSLLLPGTGLVQVGRQRLGVPYVVSTAVLSVPSLLLGLLPGTREVEVVAVRSLLGVPAELVTPRRLRSDHRLRNVAWVDLHVLFGGLAATALALGLVAAVVLIGLLLCRLAPWFLGPTWRDRLDLAEQRLAREVEHQRLARDLHDGVGHALSAISLHAAAARRALARDRGDAASSLQLIEESARGALDELDTTLGLLRDGAVRARPEPGLEALDALV